jgi:anti-sigma factor ChrR (cupin superfamily)
MRRRCPDTEKLLLHAEGELNGRDGEEVASHVADCRACAEAVSRLRVLTSALRSAGAEPGSSYSDTCPEAATVAGYVDGTLESDQARDVERHVVSCRTCLGLVADLWAMSGAGGHDAPDEAVARVLARLESDSRTAVLCWAERSIELARDFASSWAAGAGRVPALVAEPALATSRASGRAVRLHWRGVGGAAVEAVVRGHGRTASLTCRVTVDGSPAAAVSAVLSSDSVTTGPESLDADGRFGPWPLASGDNVLRLTGLSAEVDGAAELVVVLAAPADEPE